jgi:hypothetical protein
MIEQLEASLMAKERKLFRVSKERNEFEMQLLQANQKIAVRFVF